MSCKYNWYNLPNNIKSKLGINLPQNWFNLPNVLTKKLKELSIEKSECCQQFYPKGHKFVWFDLPKQIEKLCEFANCEEFSPLNEYRFSEGTAPSLEDFEALLGITLINGQKIGDVITFDNVGYHIPDTVFASNANILFVEVASGVSAGNKCFQNCTNLTGNFNNLVSAGNGCFNYCTNLTSSFNNLVSADTSCFANCTSITTFNLPSLVSVGTSCFANCTSITTFNLPNVDNFGATTGLEIVFFEITGKTITITAKTIHQTSNGGNLEGDLQYLVDNNIVTFNWV